MAHPTDSTADASLDDWFVSPDEAFVEADADEAAEPSRATAPPNWVPLAVGSGATALALVFVAVILL